MDSQAQFNSANTSIYLHESEYLSSETQDIRTAWETRLVTWENTLLWIPGHSRNPRSNDGSAAALGLSIFLKHCEFLAGLYLGNERAGLLSY